MSDIVQLSKYMIANETNLFFQLLFVQVFYWNTIATEISNFI